MNPPFTAFAGSPRLAAVDRLRRRQAAWLASAGLGPLETPWRDIYRTDRMRLRAYALRGSRPLLLIVPAPIKKAYVWDLAPGRSVVRRALAAGLDVALIEWSAPEGQRAAASGLDDHIGLVDTAVRLVAAAEPADGVVLAGHSLGGTLAAIFAALHPERVRGLVLIEAPLRFGPDAGPLGGLATALPWGPALGRAMCDVVPGSLLSGLGIAADPIEFLPARWLDAIASAPDAEAAVTHLRLTHWALDELPMPSALFADIAGRLCRDDAFYRGTLAASGGKAVPAALAMPCLAVIDPRSTLVPAASVLPVLERGPGRRTLIRHGETGPGTAFRHVGALTGREAHRRLWPEILRWIAAEGG